jgi:F-type H+-transporting ATPase subunit delta
MTNRTAARRYARALFDVAVKEQTDLAQVDQQLTAFAQLIATNQMLEKVLLNPAVPAPRKRSAVAEIVRRAALLPAVGKLAVLLAERDRLVLLPDLVAAYRERMLDHQKVVRAEVTTAGPISTERTQAIERSLATATGRRVALTTRVDPSLVGGLVARVGSTVFDGSLTTQLQKMKERLEESV